MNKKRFTLALVFLFLTVVWLGLNIYWCIGDHKYWFLLIPILLVFAAGCMVCNEFHNKRLKHLADVNKHKIP